MPDVTYNNHGTIATLTPLTPEAQTWLNDNVEAEAWQYLGASLCVEPRYAMPIIKGMLNDGLTVAAGG